MATVPTLNDIIKAITESLKVCRRFFKVFFSQNVLQTFILQRIKKEYLAVNVI